MPLLPLSILMLGHLCFSQALSGASANPAATSIDMGNGYVVPGSTWEHIQPESAGFSGARLEVLRAWLKTHQTTAMMAIYKGKVVFEYGDTSRVSKIASVRKSVLDMLFAAEGKNIKEDLNYMTVVQLGLQDKVPFIHPEELANFEQLISSRSGIYIPNGNSGQDAVSPKRGSEYPGAHFFYNNWDFDAVGTAFEKFTHKDIFDALRDDLAIPIGMQDFDRSRQKKNYAPESVHPEYAMYLSTRDMARLGVLMISHGYWGNKQLLDSGVLNWSTSLVTPFADINPTGLRAAGMPMRWGYGRLWWVWDSPVYPGNTFTGPYQGAYAAMGAGGQYITIFPMLDLVVAHKVDIDTDESSGISELGYDAALNMLLDAKCDDACK
jgi:hypothetical protein